jgi:two-component system, OmpR family, response regulator
VPDTGARILVVDDDHGMRETLADFLQLEGYVIDEAGDVTGARTRISAAPPDLILLDLNLPGGDGLGFAAELRASMATPIIIISGKGSMVDRVVGLEVGADDYLPKPFELRELLARVRALLRRSRLSSPQAPALLGAAGTRDVAGSSDRLARFAGLVFDPARRRVSSDKGEVVDLTGAEFNLLACLIERPNRVLTRDAIADATQKGEPTSFDRSIDTLVSRLRKKLEPYADAARLIQTVRGEGYVLAAQVEWSGPRRA